MSGWPVARESGTPDQEGIVFIKPEIRSWKIRGYTGTSTYTMAMADQSTSTRPNSPTYTQHLHTQVKLDMQIGYVSWVYRCIGVGMSIGCRCWQPSNLDSVRNSGYGPQPLVWASHAPKRR